MPSRIPASPVVLGIETSCDDTAAAIYQPGAGILGHKVLSQASHARFDGIVPELASRDHVAALLPLIDSVIQGRRPDAIACTTGPGLAGCLAAGASIAQGLCLAWQIPLASVNHLEGHLLSPFLAEDPKFKFPYLALLVSGGHSALYDVTGFGAYQLLGATVDDAAGEAFDKTGALLGLQHPGGPALEQLASKGDASAAVIPAAMQRRADCDFSFSGLKTAARRRKLQGCRPADIAAAFQRAAIETLVSKTELALKITRRNRLAVVGGVGSNAQLRTALAKVAKKQQTSLHHPPLQWCTDNAAMIAYAGARRLQQGLSIDIRPRWPAENLPRCSQA